MSALFLEGFAVGQMYRSVSRVIDVAAIKAFAQDFRPTALSSG